MVVVEGHDLFEDLERFARLAGLLKDHGELVEAVYALGRDFGVPDRLLELRDRDGVLSARHEDVPQDGGRPDEVLIFRENLLEDGDRLLVHAFAVVDVPGTKEVAGLLEQIGLAGRTAREGKALGGFGEAPRLLDGGAGPLAIPDELVHLRSRGEAILLLVVDGRLLVPLHTPVEIAGFQVVAGFLEQRRRALILARVAQVVAEQARGLLVVARLTECIRRLLDLPGLPVVAGSGLEVPEHRRDLAGLRGASAALEDLESLVRLLRLEEELPRLPYELRDVRGLLGIE